jgi:hypothetical protein
MLLGRLGRSAKASRPRGLRRAAVAAGTLLLLGVAGSTSFGASASTASGPPVSTSPPTIAGLARAGETLTASTGSWSGSQPIGYDYQWLRCGPGYTQLVAEKGPLGYWRLGESSGSAAADSSGRGHNGSLSGSFALGQGGALAFDGNSAVRLGSGSSSGTMSVAHRGTLNAADAVTYELWIQLLRLPTSSSGVDLVAKGSGPLVLRVLPSGVLTLRRGGGNELARSTVALAADGAYHHVVAVKAGSLVRVYIDGVDVTRPVASASLSNSSSSLTLRASELNALVDEFAVYGRGLSAAEVAAAYTAGRDGVCSEVAGATSASYTPSAADVGSVLRVRVTASNSFGATSALSAPTAPVAPPAPPASTAPPTIDGVARWGETLTASSGGWDGTQPMGFEYRWERCGPGYSGVVVTAAPIGYWRLGEASGTTSSDVSGSGHHGSYAGSYSLGRAGALALDGDSAVRLGGSSTGSMTVAHRSSLSYGNAVTYEAWVRVLRLPTSSSGADLVTKGSGTLLLRLLPSGELALRKAGSGQLTRSTVALAADGSYRHVVAVKASSLVRLYVDGVDVTGTISNDSLSNSSSALTLAASGMEAEVDEFALYNRGLSAAEVAAAYEAGREGVCEQVAGAVGDTYLLGPDDVGSFLRVAVTASNAVGSATALSDVTDEVEPAEPPVSTALPSLTGVARAGQTLSATKGSWTGTEPITYGYEWRRCDASGGACAQIADAAGTTYVLAAADVGSTVRVAVRATNAAGSATAVSAASAVVASEPTAPVNGEAPTISGEARVGESLTASPGSWSGSEPLSYAYQWRACDASGEDCSDIEGATEGTHALEATSLGGTVRVAVTASNSVGSATAVSASHGPVSGDEPDPDPDPPLPVAPENVEAPVVSGSAVVGETLAASPGSWSGSEPLSYAYQWERCRSGYADLVLARAPLGYWRFGEAAGTTASDSSGRGHDGSYGGGFVLGQPGALALDGDSAVRLSAVSPAGVVSVPHRSTLNAGDTLSVETWVRLSSPPSPGSIGANIVTKGTGSIVLRILPSGVLSLRRSSGGEIAQSTVPLVAGGGWQHVVAVKAGDDVRLYVDGVDVTGPVSDETLTNSTQPLLISNEQPSQGREGIDGLLDEFVYYGEALSPAVVAAHYAAGSEGTCTEVSGATDATYVLTAEDEASALRVEVTATNEAGSASARSALTAPVVPGAPAVAPANSEPPSISGTAAAGGMLTASPGAWTGSEPISYAYEWQRCSSGYAALVQSGGPVGYWRLGEPSGTAAADSSGNGHDGTYAGSFVLGDAGALALDDDRAVRLGGPNPFGTITVAHRATLNVGDSVTYEAWVRLNRLPSASTVGANIATKSAGTLVLRILPSGILSIRKSGGGELTQSTAALAADGEYHHVVAAKSGADLRLYLDGVDVTGPVVVQTLTNNTTQLTIAGNNVAENRDGIDGHLDEFALYGRALSAAEVAAHYAAGREGFCEEIAGASDATYLVGAADAGSALGVVVTASNQAGSASAASPLTALVPRDVGAPENTVFPGVTGTLQAGQVLTASSGTWTGSEPLSFGYQWSRCDAAGAGCSEILGATGSTYLLAVADMGQRLRVAVTATNAAGSAAAASPATAAVAIGYAGPSAQGVGERQTASKPQSKLWWNDGSWWATMWSTSAGSYGIFRLDSASQTWLDTGALIDSRPGTRADALWDGAHLYIASHVYATCGCSTPGFGQPSRLYRYSYDAAAKQHSLDAGFPVAINDTHSETLVIDKDSTGTLWATWAQSNQVYVNRTLGNDQTWGTPFPLPFQAAQSLTADDISSLVAFGGDRIGVMWSNQNANAMYFSVHRDGDPAGTWQSPEIALTGTRFADDHINLHAEGSGRVLVAMKTSRDEHPGAPSTDPLMMLLDRATSGTWAAHAAGTIAEDHTRPIVLVDEQNRRIHLFATAPTTPGGTIYHKTSPLDAISFPAGLGTPFIGGAGGSGVSLNDATSTKQSVNGATGIVVVASERPGERYWHNHLPLPGGVPPPGDTTPPVLGGIAVSAGATTATVTWTTNEPATSTVEYGTTPSYGQQQGSGALATSHSVQLAGLACATTYHYRVRSSDAAGNAATSPDDTFSTGECPSAGPYSDEFDGGALNTDLWRVLDPLGDSSVSVASGQLRIGVPGGVGHDLWSDGLVAPRILQPVPNRDLDVVAKFDSPVTTQYQMQGLVAQGDGANLVRFDVHFGNGQTRVFAATFVSGQPTVRVHSVMPGGAPVHVRMTREGSTWTLRYSHDGVSWTTATSFGFSLAVTEVGLFAGNAGSSPPAFTALADYFRVVGDGGPPPPDDGTPPVLSAITVSAGTSSATVTWTTDEPATSMVEYGTTPAYGQQRSSSALTTSHSLQLTGLSCGTTYHYRVRSSDAAGNAATSENATFATGTCSPTPGPQIEIWYGDVQRFGDPGFAQRWLNILGNVPNPASLEYSVDGGPRAPLVWWPGASQRLAQYGDFNIELDRLALAPGSHVVRIFARDANGNESTRDVEVQVEPPTTWPLPFGTDWSSGITTSAQIVDGRWGLVPGGVRTLVPGYDRLLAIGDESWTSVDATVEVTVHSLNQSTPHSGVGVAVGWRGHAGSARPRMEWPLGALCFYFRDQPNPHQLWLLQSVWPIYVATDGIPNRLALGVPYQFRVRAQPLAGGQSQYSCKLWPAGSPEPAAWDVSAALPTRAGSVLLVADYADVTFGSVSINAAGP